MVNWMKELAGHYARMKDKYPEDNLIFIFDIDGTILDTRYVVLYLLQGYDRKNRTHYFSDLKLEDIKATETDVEKILDGFNIPEDARKHIIDYYWEHKWDRPTIFQSHRSFHGVLEAIRWFIIQPKTFVGLNTGRPEFLREDTLKSLNALGKEYRIEFKTQFLYMHQGDWSWNVQGSKVKGIQYFIEQGFRVIAFIDNEPENIESVAEAGFEDILLLHADTFFSSKRKRSFISGKDYDITKLITEDVIPKERVQFIWHGLYTQQDLDKFLSSNIQWAEVDLRYDPVTERIMIRDTDILSASRIPQGEHLELKSLVKKLLSADRSVKFHIIDSETIEPLLMFLRGKNITDTRMWFHGNAERIEEEGYKKLRSEYPGSTVSAPIDWLEVLLLRMPEKAHEILELIASWGINRFSIHAMTPKKELFMNKMDEWGYEINIFNVEGLVDFLQSLILLPRSITSTFNFPEWNEKRKTNS
ncbi:MAG: hypothetical protein ACFFD4_23930 [Candidatus Odinarchaeota archaeon]